jgi:myo-inositol-1(or 4)-monophosphatase
MDHKSFAIGLAKEAGDIIKKNFTLGMKKEWKEDNSPLTQTDLDINALAVESIKEKFSEHSVLAEEGSDFSGSGEYTWVCDPLDGTIPFSHGIPTCVFSLALTRNGESILGVVYDPFMDRMFFAEKGKGAFLNEEKISVSARDSLKNTLFCVASGKAEVDMLPLVKALRDEGAKIIDFYSITYMGALVASGECGATIFQGVRLEETKPHDTAALKIIVEEAGGKVTDLFGKEQRYDRNIRGHLASNGVLHETLLKLIRGHVKFLP